MLYIPWDTVLANEFRTLAKSKYLSKDINSD